MSKKKSTPEEQARIEELLKMVRDKEENEEFEGLFQVNNLEQAQELQDIEEEKYKKKIKRLLANNKEHADTLKKLKDHFDSIDGHQKECDQLIGKILNYPITSVVGCAILYGIDIHEQFGLIDAKDLIKHNKVGSLKGVLQQIEKNG